MAQTSFDYQLVDNGGVSQEENVPMLLSVGSIFIHAYGTYKVDEHHVGKDGEIKPICERISAAVCLPLTEKMIIT